MTQAVGTDLALSEVELWALKAVCTSAKQCLTLIDDFEMHYQELHQQSPYPYSEQEIRPALDNLVKGGLVAFGYEGRGTIDYRPTDEGQRVLKDLSEQE